MNLSISAESRLQYADLVREYLHDAKAVDSLRSRDDQRLRISQDVDRLIKSFLSGGLSLADFKVRLDQINRRNPLWGFGGIIGQMFFNMLYNASSDKADLAKILTDCIEVPASLEEAGLKISRLQGYVERMRTGLEDARRAPQVKPVGYFLSYFWQMQQPQSWPILYPSIEEGLIDLGLLVISEDYGDYYKHFFVINRELVAVFSEVTGQAASSFDVEHSFWWRSRRVKPPKPIIIEDIDMAYVPPIVADIIALSKSDPEVVKKCSKTNWPSSSR
jgi:hypothetical protein